MTLPTPQGRGYREGLDPERREEESERSNGGAYRRDIPTDIGQNDREASGWDGRGQGVLWPVASDQLRGSFQTR